MTFKFGRSSESKVGYGLAMLFLGVAAGAVTALLLTPKTGQQMRRTLRRNYREAKDTFEELKDRAGDALERGAEFAAAARDAAREKVAPIAKAVSRS